VDEANDYKVTGNGCPNGIAYGKEELLYLRVYRSAMTYLPETMVRF
jgi:CxxC motif-containing protein